jgi:hypothetical protein
MANRKSSGDAPALFAPPKPKRDPVGPVYQGVCAQIRELFPTKDVEAQARKRQLLGTIAQARSVAASIDRVSGHPLDGFPTRQAAGMQLAALHHQLDELLLRLSPDGAELDEFEQLRQAMEDADRAAAEAARAALGTPAPAYDDVPGHG